MVTRGALFQGLRIFCATGSFCMTTMASYPQMSGARAVAIAVLGGGVRPVAGKR